MGNMVGVLAPPHNSGTVDYSPRTAFNASMVELVDTRDSKLRASGHLGSTPSTGTLRSLSPTAEARVLKAQQFEFESQREYLCQQSKPKVEALRQVAGRKVPKARSSGTRMRRRVHLLASTLAGRRNHPASVEVSLDQRREARTRND